VKSTLKYLSARPPDVREPADFNVWTRAIASKMNAVDIALQVFLVLDILIQRQPL